MTVHELIQELVGYSADTEIVFKCNDETTRDYDFKYSRILKELHIELN